MIRLPAPLLIARALCAATMFAVAAAAGADGVSTPGRKPLPPKRTYVAVRLDGSAPIIDGRLDDACWLDQGTWASDYIQREPKEGQPASQPTHIKLLYDDRAIYVAFRCTDSELDKIQHPRGKRDEFTGEMVGVAFDSYFDQRTGFEFDVTSAGSKIDLVLRNDGWDTSWNAVWDAKTGREDGAWTAEFRIPLSQLRYANKTEQVWGMHSWRWIQRFREESNWQLLPMDNPGLVYCFGELRGIGDLPRSRNIELLPYALAKYATSRAEPGNPFRDGSDSSMEAGLDAKIGLSSNLTLDLTLNPDFGQVEADPSEINLTTYETFFTEKRPFFLEGKNIFDWSTEGDLLFYSRRIGHTPSYDPPTDGYSDVPTGTRILGAAKLSGKTPRGLALGSLYALTNRETADVVDADGTHRTQEVEPMTHHIVARVQQDIDKGNTIVGGMATALRREIDDPALEFLPDAAYSGGFDVQHFWDERAYKFDLRLLGSRIEGSTEAIRALQLKPVHNYQRPDADHLEVSDDARALQGHGGTLRVGKDSGGKWRYSGKVDWRSPGLELNDLGYLRVADRILESATLDYVDTDARSFHRNFSVHLHQNRILDFDGTRLQDDAHLSGELVFRNNWSIEGFLGWGADQLNTRVLRGGPGLSTPGWSSGEFYLNSDSTKDYRWYAGMERTVASEGDMASSEVESGFSLRALGFLNVDTDLSYEVLHNDLQYARTSSALGSPRYIMGRMDQRTLDTTLRIEANLTPQLSLAWFGNVYLTSGRFSDFRLITEPRAGAYEDRFRTLGADARYDAMADTYRVTNPSGDFAFANPDFNWRALRSNFVLRWEYRPGSTLYVVWTQNRENSDRAGAFSAGDEYSTLFGAHPDNTFLIKASYWFSL
jgi:hypothetical protein